MSSSANKARQVISVKSDFIFAQKKTTFNPPITREKKDIEEIAEIVDFSCIGAII